MNKEYDYTEQSRRVDFECAKLLKEAGFKEKTNALYNQNIIAYQPTVEAINWNGLYPELPEYCSAPLIAIAEDKCKEWGYILHFEEGEGYIVYHGSIKYDEICRIKNDYNDKNISLAFIKAACEHKIKNQK